MAHRLGHTVTPHGTEITAGTAAEYAQSIKTVTLPGSVERIADEYDDVVGDRDRFLWKWIHNLFDEFTLSSVATDRADLVRNQKTLLTIFITTLDDLAELDGDSETFDRARRIPFRAPGETVSGEGDNVEIVDFLVDLWDGIEAELETAPRYEEFARIFEYDFRQTVNAMDYSGLLNDNPVAANRAEAERYDAYNMAVFPYACVDLMYSPTFNARELGTLRSLLCELQQMARIGNWITTWERELAEGDVSSGIAVCALKRGVITPAEVTDPNQATVDRLVDRIKSHGIEAEFMREWEIRSRAVRKRTGELDSVDAEAMVDGFETVMDHHLTSDGFK
ncbi:hypothetical protein [Halovenus amylolytica]|uniref:hypothetical protein n=1 Tax=Halovenus amylolytica TaxID=2500550 RepID=UPI00361C932E